jgi:putative addiction module component (TIGR02574 family)
MASVSVSDILRLPVAERVRLAQALWESIAAVPDAVTLSEAQRQELDRRWEAYEKDPSLGSPWADVRARIARGE